MNGGEELEGKQHDLALSELRQLTLAVLKSTTEEEPASQGMIFFLQ